MRTQGANQGLSGVRSKIRASAAVVDALHQIQRHAIQLSSWIGLLLMNLGRCEAIGVEPAAKPVLLHNLTATQASSNGPFAGAIQHLQKGFELRPLPSRVTADTLNPARIVWLVSPAPTPAVDDGASEVTSLVGSLLRHVENGGALWVMHRAGTGETGSDWTRSLLSQLGIIPGNRRTGAKRLRLPDRHPLFGGLVWATEGITPMDMEETPVLRKTFVLPNDLMQKPYQALAPDYAGMAMILGDYGRGRIGIFGDVAWLGGPAWDATYRPGEQPTHNVLVFERLIGWTTSPTLDAP